MIDIDSLLVEVNVIHDALLCGKSLKMLGESSKKQSDILRSG